MNSPLNAPLFPRKLHAGFSPGRMAKAALVSWVIGMYATVLGATHRSTLRLPEGNLIYVVTSFSQAVQ